MHAALASAATDVATGGAVMRGDRFKHINDQHGHVTGDRVLTRLAAILRSNLRATDLICRYGGEEIVVVLHATDAQTTRRTAERVLRAVRQTDFKKGWKKINHRLEEKRWRSSTHAASASTHLPLRISSLARLLSSASSVTSRI